MSRRDWIQVFLAGALGYLEPIVFLHANFSVLIRRCWPSASPRVIHASFGAVFIAPLLLCFAFAGALNHSWLYVTDPGEVRSIRLWDGSIVTLAPGTRLRVLYAEGHRTVSLPEGEAFFKVTHDASRPFEVRVAGSVVRDIGTEFNVRILPLRGTEVSVAAGSVVVFDVERASAPAPPLNALELREGEGAFVSLEEGVPPRRFGVHEVQRKLAWRYGRLSFAHETLESAVLEINRFRSRKLVIDDPWVGGLAIDAMLDPTDGDTAVLLDALSANGIESRVVVRGGTEEIHLRRRSDAHRSME